MNKEDLLFKKLRYLPVENTGYRSFEVFQDDVLYEGFSRSVHQVRPEIKYFDISTYNSRETVTFFNQPEGFGWIYLYIFKPNTPKEEQTRIAEELIEFLNELAGLPF